MSENYLLEKNTKTTGGWIYSLLLFVSFIWVALFPATNTLLDNFYFGYGNLLNFNNPNISFIITDLLAEALLYFIEFEIVFYLYRYFLSFKIYSFIVPLSSLKVESRVYFIYRNLIYGIFCNLCFFFPFIYKLLPFFDITITLIMLMLYASHLNKKYAEPIIGHFVFKNFVYPVFFYEALIVLVQILEVL